MVLSKQEGTRVSLSARVAVVGAGVLALSLLVTGCGSGDQNPQDSGSTASATATATATKSANSGSQDDPSTTASPGPVESASSESKESQDNGVDAIGKPATDDSGGDGRETPSVAPAVPVDKETTAGELKIGLEPLEETTLDDSVPGEVAGPSTKLSFRLENTGTESMSVGQAFVQADKGSDNRPAVERDGRREGDFTAPLEPGQKRTLTFYVAGSPSELSAIRFGYSPDQALVQFEVR